MIKIYELLELNENNYLKLMKINLEYLIIYLKYEIMYLIYSCWISRLKDNFELFSILVIVIALLFCSFWGLGFKKWVRMLKKVCYFKNMT